jgi:hypothetical protein
MQDETDPGWDELNKAATDLAVQLQPVVPAHVNWSVRPSRRRSIVKWHVEDRLIFERDFGGPTVEIYEPIRRRPLRGGPWTNLATPSGAVARLLSGITTAVQAGNFDK